MLNKKTIVFAALLINFMACKEKIVENKIEFPGLKENRVEILSEVKFEGFFSGANFERNEAYIQYISQTKGKFSLLIVDIPEGKIKIEKPLSKGAQESPTDFFNPAFMQYLDHRYIVIDQYQKIVFYNDRFEYLYTDMFHKHRYFIDFFMNKGEMFLVIGEKKYFGYFNSNDIRIFKVPENQRPMHVKDLHVFKILSLSYKERENRQYMYGGSIWPSGQGFEKDGKIYYANNDEKVYYVYDIATNRKTIFTLDYLKPKKYSEEDARRVEFYHSNGWEKRIHRKFLVEVHPEPLYHFGIYDIGRNKIGIIGDLDPENFTFRLDVLEAVTGKYLESIRLPFGDGFTQNITTSARGMTPTFINIDGGYYLWNNAEGEDLIDYARITHFKILTPQDPGEIKPAHE